LDGRARTVLASVVVALVLIVPLVALFAGGGGDDDSAPAGGGGLRVEREPTGLTAYVRPAVNTAERAGGARRVTLRCVDADGRLVAAQDEAWPFSETDGNTFPPHAHVTLDAESAGRVASCSLIGTDPRLEAAVR
jgi:hypothetical protein